jgi:starvation-inducible outer membrane lipoprotein
MKTKTFSLIAVLSLTAVFGGCSSKLAATGRLNGAQTQAAMEAVASRDVPVPQFSQIVSDPYKFRGIEVTWGGSIESINVTEQGTEIIVKEIPIDQLGNSNQAEYSEGRFIGRTNRKLDASVFTIGLVITVDGRVSGEETRPLGEGDQYTYPVLSLQTAYYCTGNCTDPWVRCVKGAGWRGPDYYKCEQDIRSGENKAENLE